MKKLATNLLPNYVGNRKVNNKPEKYNNNC